MATKQGGMGFRSPAQETLKKRLAASPSKKKAPTKKKRTYHDALDAYGELRRRGKR